MSDDTINNHEAFIWSVADLLRGVYKQSEYGRVILPLTVLRRLDCVLEPTKDKVLERAAKLPADLENRAPILMHAAGESFYNTSKHTFKTLLADPDNVAPNLRNYIAGFSESARDIIDKFNFDTQIDRLDQHNLLYRVVGRFADLEVHPDVVSNLEMGYIYEELIRKFSELSNETAGEHFTPREVIRLMVNLLLADDDELLTAPGIVKTMLDPACGTGGMLSVSEEYLRKLNPQGRLHVYGQELNAETYATCRSDMLIKGLDASRIRFGNSFDNDQHPNRRFDYLLANPPFGVEWKMVADHIRSEHKTKGFAGRFGAGLPRINDGSFLFLQHMISKMKRPEDGGARLAIVFNGSPLFTGAAGSGESEIRRWIIENDWLEAVVALPDQLFYNTGISTYFWVVTNRKSPKRRGKVQLIDARESWTKMRKSLGNKRKQISDDQIIELTRLYGAFEEGTRCKIFPNESFGFLRITVERPLRLRGEITGDTLAAVATDKKIAKLPAATQQLLVDKLRSNHGATYATEKDARAAVRDALMSVIGESPTPLVNAVTTALAVRDPDASVVTDRKGNPKPDPTLRDYENVPLPAKRVTHEADTSRRLNTIEYQTTINDYLETEVHPYVPDAWHDPTKTKIGYEIPLTRHFYTYTPPRLLEEIDAEIKSLVAEIQDFLAEMTV
ncbi:MAG: SAM-dependent DNA methyltransferase [Acidimicrobiia bacterium]|nr:SAM-dependent DNA methyltransferase [Acidimicrobiia bacterium]